MARMIPTLLIGKGFHGTLPCFHGFLGLPQIDLVVFLAKVPALLTATETYKPLNAAERADFPTPTRRP
jgi:hypothetical protein